MKLYLLCFTILIIMMSLYAQNVVVKSTVLAHNFSTDDNSTFLTLINMILIENRLINQSLTDNSVANTSLSFNYTDNIREIIDDILVSEDSLLVDSDQFYNNTIIATMMANLGDEVLRKYGYAFGIPSNVMINMNFSAAEDLERTVNEGSITGNHSRHHIVSKVENYSSNLIDQSQYHGALETSERMLEIYKSDLDSSADTPMPLNHSLSILENSLTELHEYIYNYSTPSKIMEIVHGKVHPSLQLAFNLTLKK